MADSSPHSSEHLRALYRASGEALDRVWLQELAALSDSDALERTRALRLFTATRLPSSDSSGLVEQQALFHRHTRT